jgi:hypothetical protein
MRFFIFSYAFAAIYHLDRQQLPKRIYYNTYPSLPLEKRQTEYQVVVRTRSIELKITCAHPFGETDFQQGRCSKYAEALKEAAEILESRLVLTQLVRIETNFQPFCNDINNSNLGKECSVFDRTLGMAAPTAMFVFNKTMANRVGLDSEYGYPPGLAKQYVPGDKELPDYDVFAVFNSGFNWFLPSTVNPVWGKSISIHGGFLNQTREVSFDLVQVAIHEYIHGLGFISSWTEYSSMFFPSYLTFDGQGSVTGMLPPWIYTKYMSDRLTGIWFDSYQRIIRNSLIETLKTATNQVSFEKKYNTSLGYKVGAAVMQLFTTPQSVLIWYPSNDDKMTFGVINTPRTFSYGSSVSHLDANTYSGIGSYVMRPSATGGIPFNRMIPNSRSLLGSAVVGVFRAMGYVVLLDK